MYFLLLCLALTLMGTGAAPPYPGIQIHARIVGGWECDKHSQPWQAVLTFAKNGFCGGVLVHPQWVLTAAHCFQDNIKVILGLHDLVSNEDTVQKIQVNAIFLHPLYNMTLRNLLKHHTKNSLKTFRRADFSHDLMLLHLEHPVQLTDAVQVLDLPTQEPQVGSNCYASGWGSINPDAKNSFVLPKTLQCVDLALLPNEICSRAYIFKMTEAMLCAGHMKGGKDTCGGDSGGPLICDGMFQGITSWGATPCALQRRPGAYVKIFSYVDWIRETITTHS
uniref:Kallikrein-1_BL2 n=1 Tax=Blarina brevicauda TaxID=9387 RepID=A0A7D5AV14_BLABR|nr:kallikrein-1_BL2 [Blarina brevicauda]